MKRYLLAFTIGIVAFSQMSFAANPTKLNADDERYRNLPAELLDVSSRSTAENDRDVYLAKSKLIRDEIDSYTNKIKELNEYNKSVGIKLKEFEERYKSDKSIASSDTMRQIRELRRTLREEGTKEKSIVEEESIINLVQKKEYDKAINRLNVILEAKKEQLKTVETKNEIWKQIDNLIV